MAYFWLTIWLSFRTETRYSCVLLTKYSIFWHPMDFENLSGDPTASASCGDISVNLSDNSVINISSDTKNELPRENQIAVKL